MTKGKLAILTLLIVACAGVNLPRLIEKNPIVAVVSTPEMDDEGNPVAALASVTPKDEGPKVEDLEVEPEGSAEPPAAATGTEPSAAPAPEYSAYASKVRSMVRDLRIERGSDRGFDDVASAKDAFRFDPETREIPDSSVQRLEQLDEQRRIEAKAKEEARLAAEARRVARIGVELEALRGLRVHGILLSRRGGVVRILGYNLRVGQTIPGSRGKIIEIHREHLVVQVEDATTVLYLPPPGLAQAKRNEDDESKEPVEPEDSEDSSRQAARVPDEKNEASIDPGEAGR